VDNSIRKGVQPRARGHEGNGSGLAGPTKSANDVSASFDAMKLFLAEHSKSHQAIMAESSPDGGSGVLAQVFVAPYLDYSGVQGL
jgi:hypothetical protein